MKKLLSTLALTVALSVGAITAYASEVPIATTEVNPAVYELNYTDEEMTYMNARGWLGSAEQQSLNVFLVNSPKENESMKVIDERCILQAVGINMGDLYVEGMEAGKVKSEIGYTHSIIIGDTSIDASYYDIHSSLTRYSNNVIVVELSERPYYRTIVEIRYDMNYNYVTHRVRENPDAVSEVTVAITKFPSEDSAYTENEMSILAEYKSFNDLGTWIRVDESGFVGISAVDHFDTSNPEYVDNILFTANTFVKKRYGCDLTGYNYKNFYLVDTWTENGMTMYSVRTPMIPNKEFILRIDESLRCVTMRGRDI